ncbi:MAG: tautomerase family protein [Rhodoferax sp.]|nr:tautomerase family protein [Rhodoferax sp.]
MPLARISIPAHLPAPQARALADAVHRGLVETCRVPPDDRFQLISRFAADMMLWNPSFPDVTRTADACVVEITFLQGRSDEQKRALYRCVVDQAVAAGFAADDIMLTLTENAPIDWSMGRGEAFMGHTHK